MPALQGRSVARATGLAAGAAADQLVAALQLRHSGAGRAYWALRAWALLVWQPAYASVLAVELAGAVLPLQGLGWEVDGRNADVSGFSVPAAALMVAEPCKRRELAARQLDALSGQLLACVQARIALHPKSARRMLADCVLAALLRAQPHTRISDDELRRAGDDWLARLDAAGASGFLAFDTAAGRPRLALDRGVCCLDDRREGGGLCNTCPRLPRAERLRRLQAQDLRNSA